jgi:hypothetical protein
MIRFFCAFLGIVLTGTLAIVGALNIWVVETGDRQPETNTTCVPLYDQTGLECCPKN